MKNERYVRRSEVNSIITGKRGVSLPFTDYCDPIFEGKFHRVFAEIVDYGKKAGWRSVELRSRNELPEGVLASARYYGHTIDLLQGEKKLFSNLRDSTRRNIKKAVAEGVMVESRIGLEAVKEFYRLNCLTRRDHGLPPQPWAFFKKVHEHVVAKNHGTVITASHNGRSIASSVFFFGGGVLYKYGASDRKFQNLRGNNMVMWEAISPTTQLD